MNWDEAHTLMETVRDDGHEWGGRPIANNTRLHDRYQDDAYEIKLHGIVIMEIHKDINKIFSDGTNTVTLKNRLNQFLPIGFYVYQKHWIWYLKDSHNDIDYPFRTVRWIHNDGRVMLYSTYPHYSHQKEFLAHPFLNWNTEPWERVK